ncbi:MAG: UDP-N-acetylmuramoyl-tripeptide--D-alanyl-D-alanine ligase [Burkholderiales bacterium]|nr:UDP-N-acetylmuramoyl-tripeptide--D-alanyl-D-alanine ligase [Burkholderiales bacterium]
MMTLAQARALLPGSRLVGAPGLVFERVHSDTRTLRAGDLFVALRGERFDAHDFLAAARAAGAVAALAERGLALDTTLPGLEVADSLAALQRLAAGWRAGFALPLIAVTGSNGKTTVTQMTAAILRAAYGEAAFSTQGNLNNHIGVALTLLRLRAAHRAGVVELGMNHVGEIALLASMARPTIALVNNAQREHQEFMATVEAVARENGAAIEALPADGCAVFPADDDYAPLWRGMAGCRRRVLRFALEGAADVVPASAEWREGAWSLVIDTPFGAARIRLAQAGRHNVKNALAATACALAAGVPLAAVEQGLADFAPVAGRSQSQQLRLGGREVTLVDDSYNANPDSALAAVEVLASLPAPRWLVLGDMGEVGARGPEFHAEVGAAARSRGIETVWSAGTLSAHLGATRHFADAEALVAALGEAPAAASILVKGSRFMKMERVVQALRRGAD